MWNFLKGMFIVRATGTARPVRFILLLVLIGSIVVGITYAFVVFQAVQERGTGHHVQHHLHVGLEPVDHAVVALCAAGTGELEAEDVHEKANRRIVVVHDDRDEMQVRHVMKRTLPRKEVDYLVSTSCGLSGVSRPEPRQFVNIACNVPAIV